MGYMTAMISAIHSTRIVFIAIAITAAVVIVVTIFARQTKVRSL